MITKIRLKRKGLKSPYTCKYIFLPLHDYYSEKISKNKGKIKIFKYFKNY